MSELKNQFRLKKQIEEIASDYLDGEVLDNLLDFVAWMRANRMTPTFANKSKEGIKYTSHVCYLKLFYKKWAIWISGKHRKHKHGFIVDFLACEELKEAVGAGLARCDGCGHGCPPYSVTVCGTKTILRFVEDEMIMLNYCLLIYRIKVC